MGHIGGDGADGGFLYHGAADAGAVRDVELFHDFLCRQRLVQRHKGAVGAGNAVGIQIQHLRSDAHHRHIIHESAFQHAQLLVVRIGDGIECIFCRSRDGHIAADVEILYLFQYPGTLSRDVHVAGDIELAAVAAKGGRGQLQVIVHKSRALGQDDEFGVLSEERHQLLGQRLRNHGFRRREPCTLCGQRVHIQLCIDGNELLFRPVKAVLRPDEEALVQLDGAVQHNGLVRVNAQLAVDHCLFVDYCRQRLGADGLAVDDDFIITAQGVGGIGGDGQLAVHHENGVLFRFVGGGQARLAIHNADHRILTAGLGDRRLHLHRILCQQSLDPGRSQHQRSLELDVLIACKRLFADLPQVEDGGGHIQVLLHRSFLQKFVFQFRAYLQQAGADGPGREFQHLAQLAGVVPLGVP